jgi:hypothetical protein
VEESAAALRTKYPATNWRQQQEWFLGRSMTVGRRGGGGGRRGRRRGSWGGAGVGDLVLVREDAFGDGELGDGKGRREAFGLAFVLSSSSSTPA